MRAKKWKKKIAYDFVAGNRMLRAISKFLRTDPTDGRASRFWSIPGKTEEDRRYARVRSVNVVYIYTHPHIYI